MVTIDDPVTGLEGLTFNTASYHLAGAGPIALAADGEIRLPGAGTTTITTPLAGSGLLAANGGGRLDLRGDNRGFTGTLSLRDGVQLRPYHSGDGSATGHETGGAETTIDIGDGSQIRWFNPVSSATYASAFNIAGPSAPLGNLGALNLDASQARTVTLTGPVTTFAPATIGTQNNGSFLLSGPVTGAHPLAIHLGNAATTLAGVVDLPAITHSGAGMLVFAETAALTLPTLVHQGGGYQFDSGATAGIGSIELDATLTLDVATQLDVPSAITGTGTLVKTGAGTLVLAGPNTFGSGTLTHG